MNESESNRVTPASVDALDRDVLFLVYDGDCLLCKHTAWALRIKKQVKEMVLVNARESHPLVKYCYDNDLDLNQGMVVFYGGKVVHGVVALQQLAGLVQPQGIFNRCLSGVFKCRWCAIVCYPFFKLLRRFFLWIRGKKAL